jgi:hypothetical protein
MSFRAAAFCLVLCNGVAGYACAQAPVTGHWCSQKIPVPQASCKPCGPKQGDRHVYTINAPASAIPVHVEKILVNLNPRLNLA